MVAFSKGRLEGRALEHALAGDKGLFVRMYDASQGKWVQVKTPEAKAARKYMKGRCEELVLELLQKGFSCSAADMPVILP